MAEANGLDNAFQEARMIVLDARTAQRARVEDSRHSKKRPGSDSVGGIPSAYLTARAPLRDAVGGRTFCLRSSLASDRNFGYCVNESEYHEFVLSNRGSPRINPAGGNVYREFIFSARQNARQELGLLVYEWGSPDDGAKDSAWSMTSEILFFPRKVTPAVRLAGGGEAYEVVLPTGETVFFDAKTKEIVGGALAETAPIDMRSDRFSRRFAGLRYDGKGIMVRSDQRGDTPRSAVVRQRKHAATVFWRGRTCTISPADVWRQDADGKRANLYPTDGGFYAMLRRRCGWIVSAADLE